MNPPEKDKGMALLCSPDGTILRIIRDDLGLSSTLQAGATIIRLMEPESVAKTREFLAELNERQAAFDRELAISLDGQPMPMHFAGAKLDGTLLIVAARSFPGLAQFGEELISINNEQANALRGALKEQSLQSRQEAVRDSRLYDDLSRVNNELANLQREMVRKNVELEKLNQSLRRSESKFRTLFDSTSDAVMLLGLKGFFDCNPASLAMFGCASREEFCGKHPADVSPPNQPDGADSLALANQQIATAMKQGTHKFEWTHQRADSGAVFPAEVLLNAMELDGKPALQATVRDISERKRGEEALSKIKNQLAHAMSLAQLVAWEYDVASGLFTFSDEYYALHGTNAQLENGNQMSAEVFAREFLHPDDAHLVADEIAKAVATGERDYLSQLECRIFRRDGELRHVLVNIAVSKDAAGRTIQLQGANQDITERKRLEAHWLQSQKMETVGKLAGGVAHQFNNLLTTIICRSEVLQGELPAGSPLIEHTAEIIEVANRAATLTRQLLAYGRKQFLQPAVLDLNELIANMEGLLRNLMGDDVETIIVSAGGLHAVKADAEHLEHALVIMLMNARDAMPNGGKLTVETANVSLRQGSVDRGADLKPGEYVTLAITDTGAGIKEEVKARLFEPFSTTKDIGKGTGLGLAACYGIIKQSGGHISVRSELGCGTTFKIYLPQVEGPTKIP